MLKTLTMVQDILFIPFVFMSLFILYSLAASDFVLQRKNISPSKIFDMAAVTGILMFILGRIFFIIDGARYDFLSFIPFFHVLRYPGLSIVGVFAGLTLGVFLLFRDKKTLPRIWDIFSLSFFSIYLYFLIIRNYPGQLALLRLILPLIFIFIYFFLIRFHKNYSIRDGSIILIGAVLISLDNILSHFYIHNKVFFAVFSFSGWVSVVGIIFCVILLLINENIINTRKTK